MKKIVDFKKVIKGLLKLTILGIALGFGQYVFACQIYVTSLPYLITQPNKTYCIGPRTGGVIEYDPSSTPVFEGETHSIYIGTDAEIEVYAQVRPAIIVAASNVTIRFISEVVNVNPGDDVSVVDVGIYSNSLDSDRVVNVTEGKMRGFDIGIYSRMGRRINIEKGKILDNRLTGIQVSYTNEALIDKTEISGNSMIDSPPFSINRYGIKIFQDRSFQVSSLTENYIHDFINIQSEVDNGEPRSFGMHLDLSGRFNRISHNLIEDINTAGIGNTTGTGMQIYCRSANCYINNNILSERSESGEQDGRYWAMIVTVRDNAAYAAIEKNEFFGTVNALHVAHIGTNNSGKIIGNTATLYPYLDSGFYPDATNVFMYTEKDYAVDNRVIFD